MTVRDIIVVGGSAGSLKPLESMLSGIPGTLAAAFLIATHRGQVRPHDYLPQIIQRWTRMAAGFAQDGEVPKPGQVYVARSGSELRIEGQVLRTLQNAAAPSRSIDALFGSAARAYGNRVIGVLLSGMLRDGTAGCWDIRKYGGVTIAQDPSDAQHSSMPQTALAEVPVDYCLPAAEMGPLLEALVNGVQQPPRQHRARVLLVEDEWLLATELQGQLEDLGHDVVALVPSGEEAIERARALRPDLVLMDVRLAGRMKGTEAAAKLWAEFQVPVIFLTAMVDQQTQACAQAAMPYAYIAKPHSTTRLHSAIQSALARRARELGASG